MNSHMSQKPLTIPTPDRNGYGRRFCDLQPAGSPNSAIAACGFAIWCASKIPILYVFTAPSKHRSPNRSSCAIRLRFGCKLGAAMNRMDAPKRQF